MGKKDNILRELWNGLSSNLQQGEKKKQQYIKIENRLSKLNQWQNIQVNLLFTLLLQNCMWKWTWFLWCLSEVSALLTTTSVLSPLKTLGLFFHTVTGVLAVLQTYWTHIHFRVLCCLFLTSEKFFPKVTSVLLFQITPPQGFLLFLKYPAANSFLILFFLTFLYYVFAYVFTFLFVVAFF